MIVGSSRERAPGGSLPASRQCARTEGEPLGKPNYQFERRQKDLAKKKKAEEKRQRKEEKKNAPPQENAESSPEAESPSSS